MKRALFALLLALPFVCNAQNWQSVRMNDTVYFRSGLRVIWIDSSQQINNETAFYFYPSVRCDPYDSCLNLIDGPTWLGKEFYRNNSGREVYFNYYNDSIFLETKASLNSTWLMHTSGIGNEYRATITNMDTLTIDNSLDSIKEITINVYNNNLPLSSHYYDGRKIILSKNHGFIECYEWYVFPNDVPFHMGFGFEVFGKNMSPHIRLPKSFNYQPLGFNKDHYIRFFYTGNVRLTKRTYYGGHILGQGFQPNPYRLVYDSIIQATVVSSSLLYVTRFKATLEYKHDPTDSFPPIDMIYNHWDTTYSHYVDFQNITSLGPKIQDKILPEVQSQRANYYYFPNLPYITYPRYTLRDASLPCFEYELNEELSTGSLYIDTTFTCPGAVGSLSGGKSLNTEIFLPIEKERERYHEVTTNALHINYQPFTLMYLKLNNCTYGNPYNIKTINNINDRDLNSILTIYPNPTNKIIHFTTKDNTKILSANLYSLLGKEINSCNNCNELKTTEIANGLYLLNIETNKGIVMKKIVVQH